MSFPASWRIQNLSDIATKLKAGGTPSATNTAYYGGDIPFVKIGDISDERKYLNETEDTLTDEGVKNSSTWIVPEGALLYTMYGSYGIPKITKIECATNQAIIALLPKKESIDINYLYYYLASIKEDLGKQTKGTTQQNLNAKIVRNIEIPLPPLDEQERIVAKIEELFSKLDSGASELNASKERLNFYNRAVLNAAMEGEFTRKARESIAETGGDHLEDILETRREKWDDEFQEVFKYSGKDYDEPESADPLKHATIPDTWAWGTVNQISYVVGGLTKNKSKREDYSIEVPYLRVANVYANELDMDEVKTIKISEREQRTKMLKEGDLLVVEGNGSKSQIGRVALWDGSISPCSHQNHLIKVRILKEELRKFVLYWLLSPMGRNAIVDVASSTSGLYTLSISKVRSIPVPIPPEEEAEKVVQEIERRTTVTDKVLEDVENEFNRTGRLRQSILKHAFEGNLVPQDPTEEPPTLERGAGIREHSAQVTLSEVTSDVE